MTPKCPLRFKEHTSNEQDQRCQDDCAWLMKYWDGTWREACAVAVLTTYQTVWRIANEKGDA